MPSDRSMSIAPQRCDRCDCFTPPCSAFAYWPVLTAALASLVLLFFSLSLSSRCVCQQNHKQPIFGPDVIIDIGPEWVRIYDADTDPEEGGKIVKKYLYTAIFNFTHTPETFCIFVSNMGAQIKLEFSMTLGEEEFPCRASLMCGHLDSYAHFART